MEVTKSSEALRCKRVTLGDLATMRAATEVNAAQASKKGNAEVDPPVIRGRLPSAGKRATRAPAGSAGVLAAARMEGGMDATRETPSEAWHAPTGTPRGAGRAGRGGGEACMTEDAG